MKTFFLCLLSAILLVFSFPPIDLEFFAYFAFVPFLIALERRNLLESFWIGTLFGFLFFAGLIYWVGYVTWIGAAVLILYLSFYFSLFGLGVKILGRHTRLLIPFLWVALEFLRSRLFTGFGWALLGYSQWRRLSFIQMADLGGAYLISFGVMLLNVVLYLFLKQRRRKTDFPIGLLAVVVFFSFALWYGKMRMNSFGSLPTFRAGVIQGNIPQDIKWEPSAQDLIMKKYEALTQTIALNGPDAVFWPETAVPEVLPDEKELLGRLLSLNQKIGTPLLVGSPWKEGRFLYNSALLLKDGKIAERYDKLHLVPFGEFIPFEKRFPFLRNWIETGDFHSGKQMTVFHHPKGAFSVLICFEDIFPDLSRRFAKDSEFLVNLTNDAWFGQSGAPFQHAQASAFRAIENRRSILRVTNTGYTCLIDPTGQVTDHLQRGGETLFVTGAQLWEIPLSKTVTFYSRHGDWFAWLCAALTLLGAAFALLERALPKPPPPAQSKSRS